MVILLVIWNERGKRDAQRTRGPIRTSAASYPIARCVRVGIERDFRVTLKIVGSDDRANRVHRIILLIIRCAAA
jgi:hypothetical protein